MDVYAAIVYIFTQSITPGPSNFMSMYSAARYGIAGARGYLLGTTTGYFLKSLLCGALAIALARVLPAALPYLKWLGGAYLLYLAIHILLSSRKKNEAEDNGEAKGSASFLSGILLQCLNIKSWMCSLTLFSAYIIPYDHSMGAVLLWTGVSLVFMILSTLLWAICGHSIKRFYARHTLPFNIVMAAVLLYCAVTAVL